MSKKLIFSLLLIVILAVAIISAPELINYFSRKEPTAIIGSKQITIEIAKTPDQLKKGLSDRNSLGKNRGMLFQYPDYVFQGFWMKGMRFPIDIIWIKDNVIVGAQQNVPVGITEPLPVYYPPEPVNNILEVNAGFVTKNNIKAGDRVDFKNIE